jgi:hypothetical protein
MRMFDKDQIGGDREISILTAEMRILKIVSERFFGSISKRTDNEMLKRKDKIDELYRRTERAMAGKKTLFGTIDQTRWGPNFNTFTFATIAAMMSKKTTESYIPLLICLISEFKGFEVPPWLTEHYDRVNAAYSLPCVTGRSHMGQGIDHEGSSCWHSLVISTIQRLNSELAFEAVPDFIKDTVVHEKTSLVTSDDVGLIESLRYPDAFEYVSYDPSVTLEEARGMTDEFETWGDVIYSRIKDLYLIFDEYIIYFGIKTSDYKNNFSKEAIEFNSEHISSEGIGSNELKFVYSLIDPTTSGNFLQDYRSAIDKYYSSSNSGCQRNACMAIVKLNYLRFCRQWKLEIGTVGLPSRETILLGMPPTHELVDDDFGKLKTPSNLRFKTRGVLEESVSIIDNPLLSVIAKERIKSIEGTREKTNFRSCITYYSGAGKVYTHNKYYEDLGAIGESFDSFVYHMNKNPYHLMTVLNPEYEIPYEVLLIEKTTKQSIFQKKILRSCKAMNVQTWQMILGLSEAVESINYESTYEQINLHMMRHERVGVVEEDIYDLKKLSLEEKIVKINEINTELSVYSTECVSYSYVKNADQTIYESSLIQPPIVRNIISLELVTFKVSSDVKWTQTYNQKLDHISKLTVSSVGNISRNPPAGLMTFSHVARTKVIIREPSIDDICKYLDTRVLEINAQFMAASRRDKLYLNILASNSDDDDLGELNFEKREIVAQDLDDIALTLGDLGFDDDFDGDSEDGDNTFEDMDDLFSGGVISERFLSIEIGIDAGIYTDTYFKKRGPTNYYLNRMVEEGALRVRDHVSGFLIDQINTTQNYCFDIDIPKKIQKLVSQVSSKLNQESSRYLRDWKMLSLDLIDKKPLVVKDDIVHKIPIIVSHPKFFISDKPKGRISSKDQMRQAVLDISE